MESVAPSTPVYAQTAAVRSRFMVRVYTHLLAGVALFIAMCWWLLTDASGFLGFRIAAFVVETSWLLILGGFMVVSWMANSLGLRARSRGGQYGAYALLIAANAVLFATPMAYVIITGRGAVLSNAAWLSILAFAGLSGIAVTTSKDFSFLRGILLWGGVLALCLIVGAVLFGTGLGTWFSVAMLGLAGGIILFETQRVYRSYPPELEVPAAMVLFASLALLFWYVLQLLSRR